MKISVFLLFLFFCGVVSAQVPQSWRYQAVARDNSGNVIASQSVSFRISILSESISGAVVYSETHNGKSTNAFGLVELEIGKGSPVNGSFSSIDWGSNIYFVKIEMDPAGGSSYQVLSTSQLLSVPYAQYARDVQNNNDADASPTNELQELILSGKTLGITNGNTVTLPAETGDNWGNGYVRTDATLTGQGTVALPLKIAQQSATSGQVLKWNGTVWNPAQDETGGSDFTLPYIGSASSASSVFEIINNNASGAVVGIRGETLSGQGYGIYGRATATTGENWGVYGISTSEFGTGVEGRSTSATGASWGVKGKSFSPDGIGVYGFGAYRGVAGESNGLEGRGVSGKATSATGINYGVYGETFSSNGYGVFGSSPYRGVVGKASEQGVYGEVTAEGGFGVYGKSTSGFGVYGTSENKGVCGISSASGGFGVYGESPKYGAFGKATGSAGRAVVGEATGTASIGVHGIATNTSSTGVWGEGANQGVYGVSTFSTGKGINGVASSATGENSGVYGETNSNSGFGVFGTGPFNGIKGIASSTTLAGHGVFGVANSSNGDGVMGYAATGTGVKGETGGVTKSGIYGLATSVTGENFGVTGQSRSSTGTGVLGYAPKYGVYGASTGTTGRAVMGEAQSSGSIGVYGKALESNSTGVWGEGAKYDFYAAGPGTDYGTSSSIRWKKNLQSIPDPIGKVMTIRGLFFDWDETHGGKHDVGMIAEEVGKVLPEIVDYEQNGIDAIGMDYSKITPLLVEAIKAQQKIIVELKSRIEKLESQIGITSGK